MTLLAALILLATPGEYTPEDTVAAIDQYSVEQNIPRAWLYATVGCETGWTFNPYSVGRQGELGAAQLHPRGRLQHFLSLGYTDAYSPWQAVRYMAQEFSYGRSSAWSCT